MDEDLVMIKQLESLRAQHRDLDDQIDAGILDEFTLMRLRKKRLGLKDDIVRIERVVYPDIIA